MVCRTIQRILVGALLYSAGNDIRLAGNKALQPSRVNGPPLMHMNQSRIIEGSRCTQNATRYFINVQARYIATTTGQGIAAARHEQLLPTCFRKVTQQQLGLPFATTKAGGQINMGNTSAG